MKKALTAGIVLAGILAVSGSAFAAPTKPDAMKWKQHRYEQSADKGQLPPPPPGQSFNNTQNRPVMPPRSGDKRPPRPPRSGDKRPLELNRTRTQQGVQSKW